MAAKSNKLILIGLVAISALIFLATPLVGLSVLSSKSQQLVDLKSQSKTADEQLVSLAAAKKQLEKYSYFNDVAKTVIPKDKDQAAAVLAIFRMASKSGIALQSITFPASTLGAKSSSSATGSTAAGSSGTTGTTGNSGGSGSTSSVSGSSGSSSPDLSQAKPVSGVSGLYSLQLTITPQTGPQVPARQVSTYPKFLDFLKRIESDRRTAQITQVNVQPDADSQELNFTLTINIFIKR